MRPRRCPSGDEDEEESRLRMDGRSVVRPGDLRDHAPAIGRCCANGVGEFDPGRPIRQHHETGEQEPEQGDATGRGDAGSA